MEKRNTIDSILFLGIKPDNAYNFYKESSTKLKQVGAGVTINSLPLPFSYNPHDTIYRFPLPCGNKEYPSYAELGFTIPNIGLLGAKNSLHESEYHRY